MALARLSAADMLLPAALIKRQPDRTTFAALGEAGISSACASCSSGRSWPGSSWRTSSRPPPGSSTWSGGACCAARCACRGTASRPFPSSSRPRCRPGPCGWTHRYAADRRRRRAGGRHRDPGPGCDRGHRRGGGRAAAPGPESRPPGPSPPSTTRRRRRRWPSRPCWWTPSGTSSTPSCCPR